MNHPFVWDLIQFSSLDAELHGKGITAIDLTAIFQVY